MKVNKTELTVSNKTVFRVLSMTIAFVLGLLLLWEIKDALILIAVSLFLAIALWTPVTSLSKKLPGNSRLLATGIAFTLVVAVLSFLIYALVPPLVSQSQNFISNLPEYIEQIETSDSRIASLARDFDVIEALEDSQTQITESFSSAGGVLVGFLQSLSSSLASSLTVLVMTFLMLVEGPKWLKTFYGFMSKARRKRVRSISKKVHKVISGYVNGQLLVAFVAAVSAYIAIRAVGVPFALSLSAIVGLFGLIPLIGASLGAVIVVITALFTSLTSAVILLIFFVVYQQVENNVIQPYIQAKTVDMSPLLVFTSAIIGVYLAGILGALLAIPVVGSIRVVLFDYLENQSK